MDDDFIARCLRDVSDGSEYLLVETVKRIAGSRSWFHSEGGNSHAELRQELESSRGWPVAVGLCPSWLQDSDVVISAIVPDKRGRTSGGVY